MPWNGGDCQAGHFKHGLDFTSDNQHIQCKHCNHYLHGALDKYYEFMLKKYGEERINQLAFESGRAHKHSCYELTVRCRVYQEAIDIQLKSRGFKK